MAHISYKKGKIENSLAKSNYMNIYIYILFKNKMFEYLTKTLLSCKIHQV